ncbi:hypothetical protein [Planctomycetes bacterium K23_9]|uniref:Uncharacterized protein n=1 Tax=Stieleria marina TaxID=1930275 RepID=A0A517NY61_9BACT|nr:hypothetical protein K239x_40690 [Planctomycetes bacterium K23_9]
MSPKHSIDFCPICGGGLCGVRICGIQPQSENVAVQNQYDTAHGLIVCDECEAIWLEPDVSTDHVYPDCENAACPICNASLWGENSRWANADDIEALGWTAAINHDLDINPDQEIA